MKGSVPVVAFEADDSRAEGTEAEAAPVAREAYALDPTNWQALIMLAGGLKDCGLLEKGKAHCRFVLETNPVHPGTSQIHNTLGSLQAHLSENIPKIKSLSEL